MTTALPKVTNYDDEMDTYKLKWMWKRPRKLYKFDWAQLKGFFLWQSASWVAIVTKVQRLVSNHSTRTHLMKSWLVFLLSPIPTYYNNYTYIKILRYHNIHKLSLPSHWIKDSKFIYFSITRHQILNKLVNYYAFLIKVSIVLYSSFFKLWI